MHKRAENQTADYSTLFSMLLSASGSARERLIVKLLFKTGLAVSELCNIRVSHTDLTNRTLRIPGENTKNSVERRVALDKDLADEIRAAGATDYLFWTRQSQRLSERRLEQIFSSICRRAGVKLAPRDVRAQYLESARRKESSKERLREELGLKSIRPERSVPKKDMDRFMKSIGSERDRLIFRIMLETGCSLDEIPALQAEDVGRDSITFKGVTKLWARDVPISRSLSQDIKQYCRHGHIFTTRQSRRITARRIEQLAKAYSRQAKVSIAPRDIRSFAISVLSRGVQNTELSRILGMKMEVQR